jgi:ATP-binding cassette subfamily C protein/competence factor transporting protein
MEYDMKFKKAYYVPQVDEADCGVAALAMIARVYKTEISLARLRVKAGTTMEGTTALGLVKAAADLGFDTRPLRADMSLFEAKELPFPFIANVVTSENFLHYYVVTGQTKHDVLIADPNPTVKQTKLSKKNFASQWTGAAIFLAPRPDYTPSKEKASSLFDFVPLLVKQRKLIANILMASLLVTLINIVGAYYLQAIIDTYVPNALKQTLGIISIALIFTYIIQQVLQFAQTFLLNVLGQRLAIEVILSYIRHLFELPMSFLRPDARAKSRVVSPMPIRF